MNKPNSQFALFQNESVMVNGENGEFESTVSLKVDVKWVGQLSVCLFENKMASLINTPEKRGWGWHGGILKISSG